MKIKRLELIGFKSFKDRTVINFDDGITGIVGPNGCGKSNIVDALMWVMGEQSAKHLRGSSMEDVIFNGSENFSPMGLAEVSLTLENDGGPFPPKWAKHSEVMITRRLHRSGESEYYINKEPARLRDIHEIFMDTGAGSKGFSIVEQGQIGKIITAKPDDRRVLIEEAAGITKFKVRKRESQRKLESTEQNLVRLNDIIGELRRQLDSLQRQAKRAERYKELKVQAQELDLWISSKKFIETRQEIENLEKLIQSRQAQDQESQAQYATMMAELQTLKLDLLEQERRVSAVQGEHFDIQSHTQRKESQIQLLHSEIESTQRSQEMAGTLKSEVAARRDIIRRDLDHVDLQLINSQKEAEDFRVEAQTKTETALKEAQNARHQDEELTSSRREMMTVGQGLSGVESRANSLKIQIEDLKRRSQEAESVNIELQTKRTEFENHRIQVFNKLESQRQMQLNIMQDVQNFEVNLSTLKKDSAEKKMVSEQLKDELNKTMSRLYGLEALNSSFEGLETGVKQIMTWQRERLQPLADGGFELVADVVEVPKDYELAMEAALGDRLQSILSPSSQNALTAVDLLKEKKAGRSTFLATDLVSDKYFAGDASLVGQDGVRGYLKDLIHCPDQHRKILAHVLNGVVVVDRLGSALKLRAQYPGYTFVTLEGDVLSQDGTLSGGSSESADSGVLKRRREIKELSLQKEELAGKLALAQAALEKVEAQVSRVTQDLEAAQKQSFEQEIAILDLKKDSERAESEFKNAEEALKKQSRELQTLAEQTQGAQGQLEIAENSIAELSKRKLELELRAQELEKSLSECRLLAEKLSQEATEAQVRLAAKNQSVESLGSQKLRLEQSLNEAEMQLQRMDEDSHRSSEAMQNQIVQLEEARSEFGRLLDQVREAEEKLKVARDEFEQKSALVRNLEIKTQEIQSQNNKLMHEVGEAQIKLSQVQINEKYLLDHMLERYMVNLAEVAHQYANREGDLAQAQIDLDDFRDKIKKIGEVNLTAIQEYEELTQRYEFLTQQQQDLLSAMDSLRKVIDRINRICNRRFRETFEAVNERFKKVFPVLFGGGEASLMLVETGEGDQEPGVEIMARPPGKKLQSVTLLSGGEKALTAVSLIFAIFLYKPSPFCLLDEVDAPLDDANVYRFNDLVREMAKRSQVILVTHNKHTMEINNKLYGVTMEDPGVSKMVAVQLNS
ncbi:MAG: chromosome segregation protein SMC [Oligoflexia bacterium]|nr:chromosome segregation protein SMC [Oligoflexia bacterium]